MGNPSALIKLWCPHCKRKVRTGIIESRQRADYRHRRRKCAECGEQFNTKETVVKKSMNAAVLD